MCLAAIGIIGAVGGIIGGIVQAQGAQQQAEAQAQQAEYQAKVARNNATAEAYSGAKKGEAVQEKGDRLIAQQQAAFVGSGVSVSTGTPTIVRGESVSRVMADVDTEHYNGKIQSQRWQDQATLHDMEAVNARKAGQTASAAALIGGFSGIGKAFSGGSGFGSSLMTG